MSRDGESPPRSALQEAARRGQGEPHILGVQEEVPSEDPSLVVDIDEFEKALRDPERQANLRKARAYGNQLKAEGRTLDLNQNALEPGEKGE